ncbi:MULTISPECIES: hypothetical protein [unclassified Ensifer]|uniref:hypothetical protein n=1 Tax=unclassified Ensifer TaxID=2633371 RepID=UPI0011479202|nr:MULTISPECIES: hypothetical protein [unclassified Ensifer]
MTDFSEISDFEQLDNRYVDKVIVYVEGEPDEKFYQKLLGPNVGHCLELKVPPTTGNEGVIAQVAEERPTNPKVFGLLDGEEAAMFGGMGHFIECEAPIFEIPGVDGLLFLFGHELETILILHGDLCEHISDDVRMPELGKRTVEEVEEMLRHLKQRFFAAALYKYTAKEIRRGGGDCKIIDVGRFQGKVTATSVFRDIRNELVGEGVDWTLFRTTLKDIIDQVRSRFRGEGFEVARRSTEMVRLADGKQLLNKMRSHYNNTARWEGHLTKTVTRGQFATDFRNLLLEKTDANA